MLNIDEMYKSTGISKKKLHDSLISMGTKMLRHNPDDFKWNKENPTRNYCYVVSEFVYWYVSPIGTKPYRIKLEDFNVNHWFLKYPDGSIIDLTMDQFPDKYFIDRDNSRHQMFMQTGCQGPSKRAKVLAKLMGYDPENWEYKK